MFAIPVGGLDRVCRPVSATGVCLLDRPAVRPPTRTYAVGGVPTVAARNRCQARTTPGETSSSRAIAPG